MCESECAFSFNVLIYILVRVCSEHMKQMRTQDGDGYRRFTALIGLKSRADHNTKTTQQKQNKKHDGSKGNMQNTAGVRTIGL